MAFVKFVLTTVGSAAAATLLLGGVMQGLMMLQAKTAASANKN